MNCDYFRFWSLLLNAYIFFPIVFFRVTDDTNDLQDPYFGLSSSDVDYLNNTESLQILHDATSSGAVDLQNPSNNIDENLLFDPTCETKGNPLEGALPIGNSDQFVQFISLGNTAEISKPLFHEKQSVCNPVMVNSNLSHTTNTVSSTTGILNQVADMKMSMEMQKQR